MHCFACSFFSAREVGLAGRIKEEGGIKDAQSWPLRDNPDSVISGDLSNCVFAAIWSINNSTV